LRIIRSVAGRQTTISVNGACDITHLKRGLYRALFAAYSQTQRAMEQRQINRPAHPSLKFKEIWGIRIRLQLKDKIRDLAMFNLAIDSKLRSCDLVKLK